MTSPALEVEYCCRRCEAITRAEAANFYYGIRLLPREKRWAMSAVYAFARRVDDIGDDGSRGPEAQARALAAERAMVASLGHSGRTPPGDAVRVALEWACAVYDLPRDALTFLVEGVEHDVAGRVYVTFDELVGYCRRVAGAVGRLCLPIFLDGRVDEPTDALADDLGVALQLTNILRDVLEDRAMGRVYLPAEDLTRFGCPDIGLAGADPVACAELIAFEAGRAACWFDRGLALADHLDGRSASCLLAMTGIYRTILERISADPGAVLRGRVRLPTWEKAWVAARSLAVAAGVPR